MLAGLLRRIWPHMLALCAVIGCLWWIDRNAARRTRAQIEAAQARLESRLRADLRQSEQRLTVSIDALAADYARSQVAIARTRAIIQPILTTEIAREPRLSDPAAGLTPGLLAAINRARATGACAATAAGGIRCALPGPAGTGGDEHR